MRLSHKAALVGLVGVPVLAVLAIRVICAVVVSWHVDPELARLNEDATRFWPELEADLKALKADPFFTTPRAGGDAGALLHSALPQASAVPRIQRSATGHTPFATVGACDSRRRRRLQSTTSGDR